MSKACKVRQQRGGVLKPPTPRFLSLPWMGVRQLIRWETFDYIDDPDNSTSYQILLWGQGNAPSEKFLVRTPIEPLAGMNG